MTDFFDSIDLWLGFNSMLLCMPLIGALIGWVTNYIAVKMLFHPRKPVRLLLFTIQGVFPKRQKALAHKLGAIVSSELISVSDIINSLQKHASSDQVMQLLGDKIEHAITAKLPESIPMLAMFLNPQLISTVKNAFLGEIGSMIEELVSLMSGKLEEELDVHLIVEEKVANFSSQKLEEILFAIMRREFQFIELIGGILGFLIGVAQMGLVLASS